MNLNELIAGLVSTEVPSVSITGLSNDSRAVKAGDAFIAYPGHNVDGRHFISQAIDNGAIAVLYEQDNLPKDFESSQKLPCIGISGLSLYLAKIANKFYGNAADELQISAVTGTNGKTTIAWLLAQAYTLLNEPSAYIGTIGQGVPGSLEPLTNTTPDVLQLQKLFAAYKSKNTHRVAMEVSSHALDQGRVRGINFKQAIFTNLTHDHIDYHGSFEAYTQAKAKLFATPGLEHAIINLDDPYAKHMIAAVASSCKIVTYGFHSNADVRAIDMAMDERGVFANIKSPWGTYSISLSLIGQFNLYNALAVFTALMCEGFEAGKVQKTLAQLAAAPGRMETIHNTPLVLVDFAHSPDALKNVLTTVKQLKKGKLIVVFGCGGERDKAKRPLMGDVASRIADEIIVTSDNPRAENPETIIDDIIAGFNGSATYRRISDRRQAIKFALDLADKKDTVLIAGKGHETYQIIGNKRIDFSDQAIAKDLLFKNA